jgi:hypothetical protein
MIIHPWIPKEGFIPVPPEEIPSPNILVGKLDFLVWKGSMNRVIPVLDVQLPRIKQGNRDCRTGNTTSTVLLRIRTRGLLFARGLDVSTGVGGWYRLCPVREP